LESYSIKPKLRENRAYRREVKNESRHIERADKDDSVLSDAEKIIYDELGTEWEAESFILHERYTS
jgi:hypothetical protein